MNSLFIRKNDECDEYEILYRTITERFEKIGVKSDSSSRRTIDLECVPEKYRNIVLDEGTLAPIYFSKSSDPNWGPLLEIVGSNVLLKSVAISDIYEEFGAGDYFETAILLTYVQDGVTKTGFFNDLGVQTLSVMAGECFRIARMIEWVYELAISKEAKIEGSTVDDKGAEGDDLPF